MEPASCALLLYLLLVYVLLLLPLLLRLKVLRLLVGLLLVLCGLGKVPIAAGAAAKTVTGGAAETVGQVQRNPDSAVRWVAKNADSGGSECSSIPMLGISTA